MPEPSEPFDLSATDAGAVAGVHRDTMIRWANARKLPYAKSHNGRYWFRRSDVEAMLRLVEIAP